MKPIPPPESNLPNSATESVLNSPVVSLRAFVSSCLKILHRQDKGTVAVTFLLSLPLLLLILSFITQYALIINAQIMVNQAAAAAARTAMVALPTDPSIDTLADGKPLDGAAMVKQSACVQLQSISPVAKTDISDTATELAQCFQEAGIPVGNSFAARYSYADAATEVHWQPLDDNGNPNGDPDPPPAVLSKYRSARMKLTVRYKFYLNAPGARILLGHRETVAGIDARFITLTASYDVQLSHGREALTDNNGTPQPLPSAW